MAFFLQFTMYMQFTLCSFFFAPLTTKILFKLNAIVEKYKKITENLIRNQVLVKRERKEKEKRTKNSSLNREMKELNKEVNEKKKEQRM